jgi:hypothetical protein
LLENFTSRQIGGIMSGWQTSAWLSTRLAIAFAALFLASPAVAEEGATTGDLRSHCLSHDPILHQQCVSYIAGVYEMTVLMGEVYELFNDPAPAWPSTAYRFAMGTPLFTSMRRYRFS